MTQERLIVLGGKNDARKANSGQGAKMTQERRIVLGGKNDTRETNSAGGQK
jgi:hypothetical protein